MILCEPLCDFLLKIIRTCVELAVYLSIVYLIDVLTE